MSIEKKVMQIISSIIEIPENEIDFSISLQEIGIDSLDIIEIINTLEDEYCIKIDNLEMINVHFLADLVRCIEAKVESIKS